MSRSSNRFFLPFLCVLTVNCLGQAFQPSATQASVTTLTKSVAQASFGVVHPHAVSFKGAFRTVAGSTTEDGLVDLRADDQGLSQAIFHGPSGDLREEQSEGTKRVCRITRRGTIDERIRSDCWRTTPWFFPQIALLHPNTLTGFSDKVSVGERPVLSVSRVRGKNFKKDSDADQVVVWSISDLHIDPKTQLPAELRYETVTEGRPVTVIATTVKFSEYQIVAGVHVPFRIQRFVNGTLHTDIHITSVEIQ